MAVHIRFARFGRKKLPFYRIRVADARCKRDGRFIENVGWYNPIKDKNGVKQFAIKTDRVLYWLSVGAQPTKPVAKLLVRTGNIPDKLKRPEPTPSPAPTPAPTSKPSSSTTAQLRFSAAPVAVRLCIC